MSHPTRMFSPPSASAKNTLHYAALSLLAACLPLGEGVALAALVLASAALVARRDELVWPALWEPPWVRWIVGGLGLFLLSGIGAWFWGPVGPEHPQRIELWFPMLAGLVTYASWGLLHDAQRRGIFNVLFIAIATACVVGLFQYFLQLDPVAVLKATHNRQAFVPLSDQLAAGGIFRHRLKMAHVLAIALCLPLALLSSQPQRIRSQPYLLLLVLLMLTTLILTFARAALLAVFVGALVTSVFTFRSRNAAIMGGTVIAVVLGVALFAPDALVLRAQNTLDQGLVGSRTPIWSVAWQQLVNHPFGIGLGNFRSMAALHAKQLPFEAMQLHAHNIFLTAGVESGWFGILGWLSFFGALLYAGLCASRSPTKSLAGRALFLCTSTALLLNLFHDAFWHKPVALTFFAIVGALAAEVRPIHAVEAQRSVLGGSNENASQ